MATASVPNTISNGQPLDASPVQANFVAVVNFLNNSTMHSDGATAFTGIPALPAISPTTANHATRKQYVDDLAASTAATAAAATSAATAAATAALDTHKSSADHDGRYYTEAEVNFFLSNRPVIRYGTATCTFTSGNGSTENVNVTVAGAGTIYKVFLQPLVRGIITGVTYLSGNQFGFQGSLITATLAEALAPLPRNVDVDYMVLCST